MIQDPSVGGKRLTILQHFTHGSRCKERPDVLRASPSGSIVGLNRLAIAANGNQRSALIV